MKELFEQPKAPARRQNYQEKDLDQLNPAEAAAMEMDADQEVQRILSRHRGKDHYAMLLAEKLRAAARAMVVSKMGGQV